MATSTVNLSVFPALKALKPEYLQALLALRTTGSVAAAATALDLTASGVSYMLRQLESQLDCALLDRSQYRASLTPAGEAACDYAQQMLELQQQMLQQLQQLALGWEERLCISFSNMLQSQVLYQWLADFYAQQVPTQFKLVREVYNGSWDALLNGRVDLVIGAVGAPPHQLGLQLLQLGQQQMSLVAHPEHPLALLPGPLNQQQLWQYRWVDASDTSRQLAEHQHRHPGPLLQVPDLFGQLAAVQSGVAIGLLPDYLVAERVKQGQLVTLDYPHITQQIPLYAGWRSDHSGLALEWFCQRLQSKALLQTLF